VRGPAAPAPERQSPESAGHRLKQPGGLLGVRVEKMSASRKWATSRSRKLAAKSTKESPVFTLRRSATYFGLANRLT
jgi:hypothetical protein